MKFKLPPKGIEFILNRYTEKGVTYYEFECWENGNVKENVAYFKEPTPGKLIRKINKINYERKELGKK